MFCPCGKSLDDTSAVPYSSWTMNEKGEIIFAICQHGHVIIDKKEEEVNE